MPRVIFLLALAAMEATLVGVPLLALTSLDLAWPWLLSLVLLGRLADGLSLRVPPRYDRPLLVGAALAGALALVTGQLGLGLGDALLSLLPNQPRFLGAYALTLIALYLFWRGTRLDTRDGAAIGALFGRGVGVIFVALILGPVVRQAALPSGPLAAHVVGFVSLGLLGLALGHANDEGQLRGRRMSWRWLLTLAMAIGLVVALGALATELLGGGAPLAIAQGIIRAILLPFAIVGAALAWLLITFVAGPLGALIKAILARLRPTPAELPDGDTALTATEDWLDPGMITRMAEQATFLLALIPIVILIAAMLIMRRRARPRADEEERESLGVLDSLAGDLRDLLGRLANPFARPQAGLRAALAALQGADPTTRARRAYVRLLLRLEARHQTRADAQTPAEFAPAAAAATAAPAPIAALTAAYEQARYSPAGADADAAARAEAALREIGG